MTIRYETRAVIFRASISPMRVRPSSTDEVGKIRFEAAADYITLQVGLFQYMSVSTGSSNSLQGERPSNAASATGTCSASRDRCCPA